MAARTIRRALLVAEVSLAIVLLVGAGLLVRSWWEVEGVDPGFRPERVLAMQVGAPALMAPAQRADFYRRALERIESLPGVGTCRLHQRCLHRQQPREDAHHGAGGRGQARPGTVTVERNRAGWYHKCRQQRPLVEGMLPAQFG